MRISPPIQNGQQRFRSLMFGVAIPALRDGIDPIHPAVFSEHIAHLRRNIRVADHTAIAHRGIVPGRHVTGPTIPGNIRVRRNIAKRLSLNGIQGTGAKHRPAARESISRDGKSRDQRGNDASSRETSQTSGSHSLL